MSIDVFKRKLSKFETCLLTGQPCTWRGQEFCGCIRTHYQTFKTYLIIHKQIIQWRGANQSRAWRFISHYNISGNKCQHALWLATEPKSVNAHYNSIIALLTCTSSRFCRFGRILSGFNYKRKSRNTWLYA